jgi:hypothetical protein
MARSSLVAPPLVGGMVFINAALIINDFGSHKGCRYMIYGYVFVAAPLVGAIVSKIKMVFA